MNAQSIFHSPIDAIDMVILIFIGLIIGVLFAYFHWKCIQKIQSVRKLKSFLFLTTFIRLVVFFLSMVLIWKFFAQQGPLTILLFFFGFMIARSIFTRRIRAQLLHINGEHNVRKL